MEIFDNFVTYNGNILATVNCVIMGRNFMLREQVPHQSEQKHRLSRQAARACLQIKLSIFIQKTPIHTQNHFC